MRRCKLSEELLCWFHGSFHGHLPISSAYSRPSCRAATYDSVLSSAYLVAVLYGPRPRKRVSQSRAKTLTVVSLPTR